MTTTLDIFGRTIQETQKWLNELQEDLSWSDPHEVYLGFRATLHVLRDRLVPNEAIHLGAQLPMLIRGFYYDGYKPAGKPIKILSREEFLAQIKAQFINEHEIRPEELARAVFRLLSRKISPGEIKDVRSVLPKEIEELWPPV